MNNDLFFTREAIHEGFPRVTHSSVKIIWNLHIYNTMVYYLHISLWNAWSNRKDAITNFKLDT